MRKISILMATAAMAIAAPAMATYFTVNVANPVTTIPGNNDFKGNLNGLGLTGFTSTGASIALASTSTLTFEYMGSESGFVDTFKVGASSFAETNQGTWGPTLMFSSIQLAGLVNNWLFTSDQGAQNKGIGTAEFGIFVPSQFGNGGLWNTRVLYLGFDDQINNVDDNHDDFIVRVSVDGFDPAGIPEPSSWAMLIAGFGLVGAARRHRRTVVAA